MIDRFVTLCLKRRQVVWLIAILMAIFGYSSWKALKIEAYPDIADVSSQVITQYPGHAAEEVEEQVTVPLERELNGIPGLQIMRSHSTFGLSLDHIGISGWGRRLLGEAENHGAYRRSESSAQCQSRPRSSDLPDW